MIVQIDQWVLEAVCQCLIDWQQTVDFDLGLMLNMSIPSLQVLNIQTIIQNRLGMPSLPPNLLHIEISEKSTLSDLDSIAPAVQMLLRFGFGFSLDDFGAGHSSLKYLEMIPLQSVKIDKSFIQNIGHQRDAEIIIKTVITLAHQLNLTVVAEGVETEAQLNFLDEQACDYVQGYLFSPAKPLAETSVLVNQVCARRAA